MAVLRTVQGLKNRMAGSDDTNKRLPGRLTFDGLQPRSDGLQPTSDG